MLTLPPELFRRPPPTGRFGALFRVAGGDGPTSPRRPGPVSGLAVVTAGDVVVSFGPPAFAGDGPAHGDGLGVVTDHQVSINYGPWVSVGAAGGTYSFAGQLGDVVRVRALGYAGRPGQVRTGQVDAWAAPPPSGPGLPTLYAGAGEEPGEVTVAILAPPLSPGDGPAWGDGAGVVTGYEITIAGVASAHPPLLLPTVVSGGHTPGALVPVTARALGYAGRPGSLASTLAMAAVDDPQAPITVDDDPITVDGEPLTVLED